MQPFNEVLASMICKRLGIYHIPYTINVINDKITSKCECFINKDTELVPAHHILYKTHDKTNAYETYINILEEKGLKNARNFVEEMFILDYIMLNEDRHLNNFGIIRNVETFEWVSIAPIFDTGQSLNILDYNDEDVLINSNGRFFYDIDEFDSILKHIKNIKRFDLSKLEGLEKDFDELLRKYQKITKITDRRINKICTLLLSRISKLKRIINEQS